MDFILASSSPRRKELLNLVGIDPLVICPDIKEKIIDGESLEKFLERITAEKAWCIYRDIYLNSVIFSADTIVLLQDKIMGKPVDRRHAYNMLASLSDQMHEVWTGISIVYKQKIFFDHQRTKVYFEKISDSEIEYYLDHEQYLDKAGAYAIQGRASVFVKRIEGCYFNVMGLPLHLIMQMLKKIDIQIYSNR